MSIRSLVFTVLAGLGVYALACALAAEQKGTANSVASARNAADTTRVVSVVEETLHRHEGEGASNPIVHAFEEALEHKAHAS